MSDKIRIEQHSAGGMLWGAGWLFTIGFLHLTFWKGALALLQRDTHHEGPSVS